MAQLQQKWIFPRLDMPSPSRNIRNISYHRAHCYSPDNEFLMDWGDIVAEYTRRKLTFRGAESHRVGIAPSWSWASTDGEVLWSGHMLCRLESKADIVVINDLTAADEDLGENVQLWFAELAAGVNHNLRNRKEVHCLVLLACDGADTTFRRVGYSIWEEQKWENEELPELKRKKLTIL
ncbi:hypothetical protein DL769_006351 [Monosporascus sp. CRB-8-3]|nr:hypothetical protein DL769_006351 [Monosporascus sp. CRB-8-3]